MIVSYGPDNKGAVIIISLTTKGVPYHVGKTILRSGTYLNSDHHLSLQ